MVTLQQKFMDSQGLFAYNPLLSF